MSRPRVGGSGAAARALRQVPGVRRAAALARRERSLRRLLATGRFDADWYAAQTAPAASTPARDLAADYLARGRRAGLAPHPLFEPSWYDPDGWRTRSDDPFTAYLSRAGELRTRSPHVLLDPAAVLAAAPQAASHRHGPFGAVVDGALDATPVLAALQGRALTWPLARHTLVEALGTWRAGEALRRAPRRSRTFDRTAEAVWKARTSALPLPAVDGDGPLVDVVTPVRGRPALLRRAVASVQAQTLQRWRLLVVDDGSDDDTPQVLAELAAADPRIVVHSQPPSGVSAARNRALGQVGAPYVAFLDSDNTWQPDFLDLALRAMAAGGLQVAHAAMELHGPAGETTYRAFEAGLEHLLVANHVDLNVLVVTAQAVAGIGGFTPGLRRAVDYDLVLRLARRHRPALLPFVGAVYTDDSADTTRISVAEPLAWDYAVRARNGLDAAAEAARERAAGRVSVLVPVAGDVRTALATVRSLLDPGAPGGDVEVVLLDLGCTRADSLALAAAAASHDRVRVHRQPVDTGLSLGLDLALAEITGQVLAVCLPGVAAGPGWARAVLAALEDDGVLAVQPAALDAAGLVAGAGALRLPDGRPVPLLLGHPAGDLTALAGADLPGLWGPLWAARTADVAAVGGLDPLVGARWAETDLSWRLRAHRAGRVLLLDGAVRAAAVALDPPPDAASRAAGDPDAVMRQRYGQPDGRSADVLAAAGWLVDGLVDGPVDEQLDDCGRRPRVTARLRRPAGAPARWQVVAEPGLLPLADAVAAGLRDAGRDAVVVTAGAPVGGPAADVTLRLASPDASPPPAPAGRGVLWRVGEQAGQPDDHPDTDGWTVVGDGPDRAEPVVLAPAALPSAPQTGPAADRVVVLGDFATATPRLRASVAGLLARGREVRVAGRGWELLVPAAAIVAGVAEPAAGARAAVLDESGQAAWQALTLAGAGVPVILLTGDDGPRTRLPSSPLLVRARDAGEVEVALGAARPEGDAADLAGWLLADRVVQLLALVGDAGDAAGGAQNLPVP